MNTIPIPTQVETLSQLSEALDNASHNERINWMRGLSKGELRTLYDLAQGGLALSVSHFHAAPGEIVIHHGQNSLVAFNAFQKRCLLHGETAQGYNHQTLAWLTGPGHFTLRPDGDEVLFDYTVLPAQTQQLAPQAKNSNA